MNDLILIQADFEQFLINKLVYENQIIGYCAISDNETNFEIEHLWVLPEHMNKGYGKFLLTETLKVTQSSDKEILVVSDPNSEAFYSRMGFKTFDKYESYPKGRFLPVMKKKIITFK